MTEDVILEEVSAESAEDSLPEVTEDGQETLAVDFAKQRGAEEVQVRFPIMKQFESSNHSVPSQPDWKEDLVTLLVALTLLIPGLRVGQGRMWSVADRLSIQRSRTSERRIQ